MLNPRTDEADVLIGGGTLQTQTSQIRTHMKKREAEQGDSARGGCNGSCVDLLRQDVPG